MGGGGAGARVGVGKGAGVVGAGGVIVLPVVVTVLVMEFIADLQFEEPLPRSGSFGLNNGIYTEHTPFVQILAPSWNLLRP